MLIALINSKTGGSYKIVHNQIITIKRMCEIMAQAGNANHLIVEPNNK